MVSVSSVYAGSGERESEAMYGVLLLTTRLSDEEVPEEYWSEGVTIQETVSPAMNPPDRVVVVVLIGVPFMLHV